MIIFSNIVKDQFKRRESLVLSEIRNNLACDLAPSSFSSWPHTGLSIFLFLAPLAGYLWEILIHCILTILLPFESGFSSQRLEQTLTLSTLRLLNSLYPPAPPLFLACIFNFFAVPVYMMLFRHALDTFRTIIFNSKICCFLC